MDSLNQNTSISFEVRVYAIGRTSKVELRWVNQLRFNTITFTRDYTPLVYYLSPRAVYKGSELSVFADPKATVNLKSPDAITATIDGVQINFLDRGTNPNTFNIANGALNEIKGRSSD